VKSLEIVHRFDVLKVSIFTQFSLKSATGAARKIQLRNEKNGDQPHSGLTSCIPLSCLMAKLAYFQLLHQSAE